MKRQSTGSSNIDKEQPKKPKIEGIILLTLFWFRFVIMGQNVWSKGNDLKFIEFNEIVIVMRWFGIPNKKKIHEIAFPTFLEFYFSIGMLKIKYWETFDWILFEIIIHFIEKLKMILTVFYYFII